MGIEGGLSIDIYPESESAERVVIGSTRPVHASRLFRGKGIDEVLSTVPMLFSICGTAQACAAVRAIEQALAMVPAAGTERLRNALVRIETIREHLWRILLDWPAFVDEGIRQESMAEMAVLHRDARQALCGDSDPFLPGVDISADLAQPDELTQKLSSILDKSVFGMAPGEWLALDNEERLAAWAETSSTVAAKLIARVTGKGWSSAGRCDIGALPPLESRLLHRLMQEDAFIERPQWDGSCYETSSFTRSDSALPEGLRSHYGNGLLVRLVARLTELAQLAVDPMPREIHTEYSLTGKGAGIGQATAARGELLHRVTIENDAIADYRILAPTEWNFHPQSVVAASLAALRGDELELQARLLINAIDPCVAYTLRIA